MNTDRFTLVTAILIALYAIAVYVITGLLNKAYFNNSKFIKASRALLVGGLLVLLFRQRIIADIATKQYTWLSFAGVFFAYFIYMFIRDILKKEEQS